MPNKKTFKPNTNEYLLSKWVEQIVKDSEIFMDGHLEFDYPCNDTTARLTLTPSPLIRKRSLLFKDMSYYLIHLHFNNKLVLTYRKDASESKYNDFSVDKIDSYQVAAEVEWVALKDVFRVETFEESLNQTKKIKDIL
jgi:hypothetical protein